MPPCSGYLNTLAAPRSCRKNTDETELKPPARSHPFQHSSAAKEDHKREYSEAAASMQPQRAEEQLVVRGAGGGVDVNNDAGGAACLCPATIAAAAGAARGPPFPRHALEQELLRRAELQLQGGGGDGDQHRERKMKSRASAERSRARRLAYMSELEKEVSLLQAENGELRKLCQELKEAAEVAAPAVTSVAAPQPLRRTSSA